MTHSRKLEEPPQLIGAGRSGQVYRIQTPTQTLARKVFYGETLTHIIHYIFFGAPNPYIWNEDAIQSAYYRRKIANDLVQVWFGDRLQVANAIATGWDEDTKAYLLDTEFVTGRAVALYQPFRRESRDRDRDLEHFSLVNQIMLPLQRHLIQSGLDGLVWQAGKGNPVAFNNFLLVDITANGCQFVWIDLESGVPAIVPLNSLSLVGYYLPKCFYYKRALFDDVDISKLKDYIQTRSTVIAETLGEKRYTELLENVEKLGIHQAKWKSLGRFASGIQYQLKQEKITPEEAEYYLDNRLAWYARELKRFITKVFAKLFIKLPHKIARKVLSWDYQRLARSVFRYIVSNRYRLSISKNYVTRRIQRWVDRDQLRPEDAETLLSRLHREHASDYLNDFGVHIALKILVKVLEYILVPILYAMGYIDELLTGFLMISGGYMARTLYTGMRSVEAALNQQEIPWIALIVGLLPMVGNIAYPCQMIYSAAGRRGKVAQFIVYDTLTRLGDRLPIWGGEDTLTEHYFNALGDRIIHGLRLYGKQTN
ncbi:hypothetical protein QQ056_12120 [Oscillatoria laete-virens NRMC-F 0139]|nr:hypothetical protein [Oscillatoria laete-virens]MDL5054290.1 hypothetical protein [Oscillatoria laete-virens NRMC-F 0139]